MRQIAAKIRGAASLLLLIAGPLYAQSTSTLCQAEEVPVPDSSTIDLRLIGCGEGFPDNLLWNLDRADSLDGTLDGKVKRSATGKGAVVYLIDTGVMRDHDEFTRATGSTVIAGIRLPNGSGCPGGKDPSLDPCYSGELINLMTHGTATASIVGGRTTGVAPDAKIVSVLGQDAATVVDRWLTLLDAIIRNAYDPATPPFRTAIVSMSFVPGFASTKNPDYPKFTAKMKDMIGGVDAEGHPDPSGKRFLFVTLAGNYMSGQGNQCTADMSSDLFPAVLGPSIDGLITVGGIDRTNHLWDRSCRGSAVEILAPADGILVASISAHDHYRSGRATPYPWNSGTSYAAPYVAGLAALLLEKNPEYTPPQLEAIIRATATRTADRLLPVASFDMISTMPRRRAAKH